MGAHQNLFLWLFFYFSLGSDFLHSYECTVQPSELPILRPLHLYSEKKHIGGKGLKKRSVKEEVWSVVCFNVLQQDMRMVSCLKLRSGEEELWSEVYF